MGLDSIAQTIHNDNKKIVIHQTWGHLFPDRNKDYFGYIRIAKTDYGDLIVLQDKSEVPSSPWWYETLHKFTTDFLINQDNPGTVFEIQTKCTVFDVDKDTEEIKIHNMGYKIILK